MKNHKVIRWTVLQLKKDISVDKNDYFNRHNMTEVLNHFNVVELNKINYAICKNEYENSIKEVPENNDNCPYWGPWISIGEFGGSGNICSKKCGLGKRQKIRDCYINGIKQDTAESCINEFPR